jgi:hypothetical protein
MAFNLNTAWKVAQAIFGLADASRRILSPVPLDNAPRREPGTDLEAVPGGLLGQFETRLTGLVVSALKEAFDRDAQRLEAERAALEDQRRRAEEALRLELVRQAADRALARLRAIGVLALAIWVVSVLFTMRLPEGFAGIGRLVLACGWASLVAGMMTAFVAHGHVSRWVATAQGSRATPAELPEGGPGAAAPWLVLAGLALVATSLLMAL